MHNGAPVVRKPCCNDGFHVLISLIVDIRYCHPVDDEVCRRKSQVHAIYAAPGEADVVPVFLLFVAEAPGWKDFKAHLAHKRPKEAAFHKGDPDTPCGESTDCEKFLVEGHKLGD